MQAKVLQNGGRLAFRCPCVGHCSRVFWLEATNSRLHYLPLVHQCDLLNLALTFIPLTL